MRLETCIRKGLRLKAHRVREVREAGKQLIASVERFPGRAVTCSGCGRGVSRVHSYRPDRQWRDLRVRDQDLVLVYASVRVRCRRCGVRVEAVPWADHWQRIRKALALVLARLVRMLSWK